MGGQSRVAPTPAEKIAEIEPHYITQQSHSLLTQWTLSRTHDNITK